MENTVSSQLLRPDVVWDLLLACSLVEWLLDWVYIRDDFVCLVQ